MVIFGIRNASWLCVNLALEVVNYLIPTLLILFVGIFVGTLYYLWFNHFCSLSDGKTIFNTILFYINVDIKLCLICYIVSLLTKMLKFQNLFNHTEVSYWKKYSSSK